MPQAVVIRVDFGTGIGLGHFTRCAALAAAVRAGGGSVAFASAGDARSVTEVASAAALGDVPFQGIHATPGSLEDAAETRAIAANADWLVVDGYSFNAEYMNALRPQGVTRPRLAYIDDLASSLPCDLVVRGHLHFATHASDQELSGPRYALVRAPIAQARARRASVKEQSAGAGNAPTLLVTFGGSDALGHTERVLDALTLVTRDPLRVIVCIGSQNTRAEAIRTRVGLLAVDHDISLRTGVDLAEVLPECDLAISAAGTTTLELACVGIPALVWAIADNQVPVASAAEAQGIARAIPAHATAQEIASLFSTLAADHAEQMTMQDRGRALVDGEGAGRVAGVLARLV